MVPWGTGDPISSGDLNTLVFLTEKPPPLSVSIGGGSMSLFDRCDISDLIRCFNTRSLILKSNVRKLRRFCIVSKRFMVCPFCLFILIIFAVFFVMAFHTLKKVKKNVRK